MSPGLARGAQRRRVLLAAGLFAAVVAVGIGVCEAIGWPFLAGPMQRWLGDTLDRRVSLSAEATAQPQAKIHLLGGIRISAPHIEIGAPSWSTAPHMLQARDARMTLGYTDLWRASRGAPLRIRELSAAQLDGRIERLADGRASWNFGKKTHTPDTSEQVVHVPAFGRLQVDAGTLTYRDAMIATDLDGRFSLTEGAERARPPSAARASGLHFEATGSYRRQPLRIALQTPGVLPAIAEGAAAVALPVVLDARIGGASLSFRGTTTDALHLSELKGRFSIEGPSLAAAGAPLRVVLPTTGPFRAEGLLAKRGEVWNAVIDQASIGSSRVAGAFTFDPRPRRPLLSGRLSGPKLLLADLGPVVGAPVKKTATTPAPAASAAPASRAARPRVLPQREFDLPSLRAMDANVLIDIDSLDLGSSLLEPLRPLRSHLLVNDGVLTLRDLDARTGQGRLAGTVQLDGRNNAQALWTADLRWAGVRLERWIHQTRANNAPPYLTGDFTGQARVSGQGRSTAAILGSLRGGVRIQVFNGTVSHLAIEAVGLDIAEALGVMITGDEALPIDCTVADLVAEQGVLRPRVLVLDTPDSTLWVDGSLSLANEALDLRVVVSPKDFSPLTLRTPVHVRGSFENPSVSIDKGGLGTRLGASALLAFVNPLAALIPMLDTGNSAEAERGANACRALARRAASQRPPPAAAKPAPTTAGRAAASAPR